MIDYRKDLPPMPDRIARLPVEGRGYPVPWFVPWFDEHGKPVPTGQGKPDFRLMNQGALVQAVRNSQCWICGESLGAYRTFVIGPMCGINRISSEPPSHLDCADFAAKACPFLSRPSAHRRETNMPALAKEQVGIANLRNPGLALLWTTKRYRIRVMKGDGRVGGGVLFHLGEPEHVRWICEGREATREEVMSSMDSGLVFLRAAAEEDGPAAIRELDAEYKRALRLVPAA